MKVRWTATGVRLRITPTELQTIADGDLVTAELALAAWSVRIAPTEGETCLSADGPALTLALSRTDAARLAEPDREGVYFERVGDTPLRYFIEKDFPCVHTRAPEAVETPTETFAEPPGFRERKGVC